MKIIKATVYAILRFLGFVVLPLYLAYLITTNFPDLLPYDFIHFCNILILVGLPLIIFYFLSEALNNWKLAMLFEFLAITLVLFWTYYILGGGKLSISYQGINFSIDYFPFLALILLGIALKYPASAMKHYLRSHSEQHR